jgi:gliding motility-associated lipoprotein GldH
MAFAMNVSSCKDPRIYDHYESIDVRGWEHNDTLVYSVKRLHAGGIYHMNIGLRATDGMPYTDLAMIMKIRVFPGNKLMTDTIHCSIIDDKGKLLGKNGVSSSELQYHITDIQLKRGDSLQITLNHAMSRDEIPGLTEIGMQLTK